MIKGRLEGKREDWKVGREEGRLEDGRMEDKIGR